MKRLLPLLAIVALPARAQNWDDPFADVPYALPTGYHDPMAVFFSLQKSAEKRPDIARLQNAGRSHGGRSLPYLTISDGAGEAEPGEPRVFLGAAMHGDEAGTQELLLRFKDHLLSTYGTDARTTRIVDGLAIVVMPTMNPDGVAEGKRTNGRGVDLNRDCPAEGTPDSLENRAFLDLFSASGFAFAFAFHAGGAAFVLPWDGAPNQGTEAAPRGLALMRKVGHVYASHNPLLASTTGPDFLEPGVITGNRWYPVPNSLPDCVNLRTGAPLVSVEVGLNRMPTGAALDELFNQNLESLLASLESLLPQD